MMKKLVILTLATLLMACSNTNNDVMVGGTVDAHGCNPSTGASYSFIKKECVQVFNVADIKLPDPTNDTLAVYVILSEDKQQAEIFGANLPENTILESVKGGYVSKDRAVRLNKDGTGWKLYLK
ncbi:hypothetical protein IFE17_09755 [Actinobacillus sp. GY-402]|nr:hypothetical protein IFE17_09755 [Actinobacillus sp. GY-402]